MKFIQVKNGRVFLPVHEIQNVTIKGNREEGFEATVIIPGYGSRPVLRGEDFDTLIEALGGKVEAIQDEILPQAEG